MSTPTKHTPGPWSNDPLQPTIWANDGQTKIATISELPWKDGKSDWLTEQSNARLIASAPDLLEALKAVSKLDYLQEHNALALKVKSAIDRAEGKA